MKYSILAFCGVLLICACGGGGGAGGSGSGGTAESNVVEIKSLQEIVENEDLSGVIETQLPLVYKRGDEFYVLPGFDANRKGEIWGFVLKSGVFLELAYSGPKSWTGTELFAKSMSYKGKKGSLPSLDTIRKGWGRVERQAMEATVATLAANGIKAEAYKNVIWSSTEMSDRLAFYFILHNGEVDYNPKGSEPFERNRGGVQPPRIAIYFGPN